MDLFRIWLVYLLRFWFRLLF